EHPVESRPRPGFHSSHASAKWGVAFASYRVEKPIRLRGVPSSHENDRLSWPGRQTVRRASDDTDLEHNSCDRADLEGPGEDRLLFTRHRVAAGPGDAPRAAAGRGLSAGAAT